MAIRNTTHVLKKSLVPSQTLPASGILQGEPLINIGDGILFFTGGTSGSPTWVQSDNPTPGYFEVGSNLYQLKIRDKIISYSGVTNLSGKFLSGSTNGFVLADISSISPVVNDKYWTSGSTGTDSIKAINASGLDSTGDRSVSWGNSTLASGNDSTSWGVQTSATTIGSTASGYQTLASGSYSHSEGYLTKATQNGAHAEGINTTASGYYSHSEGNQTTSSGDYSTASGYYTVSSGKASTASGAYTTASGNYSNAEGRLTLSSGIGSHSEGSGTSSSGDYSHAEGQSTTSLGNYSHSEGKNTTSTGQYSHAEGQTTIASGNYSHAEGVAKGGVLTASGYGSHAEGFNSTASGIYSHTEGGLTVASGKGSHAEGRGTTSSGDYSHSQGSGSISQGNYSFASGINSIASVSGTFIHSNNSLVNGTRSVVLGGQNITGSTNDTVYVPYLNLNYVPTLNNSNTEILSRNSSTGQVEYTPLSAISSFDTYVTGFTYSPNSNTFTIKQNQGQPDLTASFDEVSGLTVTNDLVVMGDLSVFGMAISAFTSQLYVEDPSVIFNYNPTGSTTLTSVNSGMVIQDGNGLSGGSVNLDIVRMQNLTGLTSSFTPDVSEYSGSTGYVNRGWITQLNDIVIRSTDVTDGGSPGDFNGVRVLAEGDVLDGGQF